MRNKVPYDINGQPIEDEHDSGFPVAIIAAVAAVVLIFSVGFYVYGDSESASDYSMQPTYALYLDCSNAAMMHEHGLPTKADVMQWHYHGQWGYYMDGALHAYSDLPGREGIWDALYEIEPNPAFDK